MALNCGFYKILQKLRKNYAAVLFLLSHRCYLKSKFFAEVLKILLSKSVQPLSTVIKEIFNPLNASVAFI